MLRFGGWRRRPAPRFFAGDLWPAVIIGQVTGVQDEQKDVGLVEVDRKSGLTVEMRCPGDKNRRSENQTNRAGCAERQILLHRAGQGSRAPRGPAAYFFSPVVAARPPPGPAAAGLRGMPLARSRPARSGQSPEPRRRPSSGTQCTDCDSPRERAKGPAATEAGRPPRGMMPARPSRRVRYRDTFKRAYQSPETAARLYRASSVVSKPRWAIIDVKMAVRLFCYLG